MFESKRVVVNIIGIKIIGERKLSCFCFFLGCYDLGVWFCLGVVFKVFCLSLVKCSKRVYKNKYFMKLVCSNKGKIKFMFLVNFMLSCDKLIDN